MAADPLAFLWEAVIEQMMIPFEELFFGSRFQALKKQQTANTAALNALKARQLAKSFGLIPEAGTP